MNRLWPGAALSLLVLLTVALSAAQARAQEEPTARASPTATPSPPDPALAAEFAQQGKFDEAIGAYLAVLDQGTAQERLDALLALARIYLDDGQAGAAASRMEAYLLQAPAGTDVRAAQLLLAEALAAQAKWGQALLLYDAYIQAGGGASLYARIGRAEALAALGRSAEAVFEGEALLVEALPSSVRLDFILTMAQSLEDSSPRDAVVWYDRLGDESESPDDQALGLWRSALIQRDLGNPGPWSNAALTIIQRYPGTPTALEAVEDFPPTKIMMDSYPFGLVYYLNSRYDDARTIFEEVIEVQPPSTNAARAAYYLAVMDEGEGAIDAAIDGYARVVDLDPKVELADDALWWLGRVLEQQGRTTEARVRYTQLAAQYGSSDWGAKARFRLGLLDYDARAFDGAATSFAAIAASSSDAERQRALLWQGKALAAQNDGDAADAVWAALRREAPDDYYGLRAAVVLGEADGTSSSAELEDVPISDWSGIDAWLRTTTGADLSDALETLLYSSHWGLGQELLALGMERRASSEFSSLLEDAGDDPAALSQAARYLSARGVADISSRAAARLLNALPEESRPSAPADLWRLAYPAPQRDILDEVADEADVPNLLMLALVRQESFFDPLAGSLAGALGLTQVIAPTGFAIANELKMNDFEVDDLFRPSVSLEFGAHYLSQQLGLFDGNIYEALAAYNAGPGSALRWENASGGDIDRFVEEIEFGQTEAYVKLVSENLARYRQLYLGLDAPSLPEE